MLAYEIVEKESFKVIGSSEIFSTKTGYMEIPKFWDKHYFLGKGKYIHGMYGICINIDEKRFEYAIADDYDETKKYHDGFRIIDIPKSTWAVFKCIGPISKTMSATNKAIYSYWMKEKEYEIAGPYNIEVYSDPAQYPNGMKDEKYEAEIWVQVKKK